MVTTLPEKIHLLVYNIHIYIKNLLKTIPTQKNSTSFELHISDFKFISDLQCEVPSSSIERMSIGEVPLMTNLAE